jgi:hypothetical protein
MEKKHHTFYRVQDGINTMQDLHFALLMSSTSSMHTYQYKTLSQIAVHNVWHMKATTLSENEAFLVYYIS